MWHIGEVYDTRRLMMGRNCTVLKKWNGKGGTQGE